jgi:hypothetical protein
LEIPTVSAATGGETEHLEFWATHEELLRQAWQEWAALRGFSTITTNFSDMNHLTPPPWDLLSKPERLFNATLYQRIRSVWETPTDSNEQAVKDLWHEIAPGLFVIENFFSFQGIEALRQYHLDAATESSRIPTRRPNGMNRYGLVMDDETPGGVSYPHLDQFRTWLIDTMVRPMARALFPEYTFSSPKRKSNKNYNDDVSYAFTVHYSHDGTNPSIERDKDDSSANTSSSSNEDRYLPVHTDASLYTCNINLNFQHEYDPELPSQLVFYHPDKDGTKSHPPQQEQVILTMKPGMAVLHRGLHPHQALPIQFPKDDETSRHHHDEVNQATNAEAILRQPRQRRRRDQLIIWLFGRDIVSGVDVGEYYVRAMPYSKKEQMTVQERWSKIQHYTTIETGAAAEESADFPMDWL